MEGIDDTLNQPDSSDDVETEQEIESLDEEQSELSNTSNRFKAKLGSK